MAMFIVFFWTIKRNRERALEAFKKSNPSASDAEFKVRLLDLGKWVFDGIVAALGAALVLSLIV